ncbi:hypothetical protein LXL04_033360 [Taraxacum kok-saghyz]
MIRKPIAHKDKYSNRYETSQNHSNEGTSARTRPYSFDEIMHRRKTKKLSGNVEGQQRLASEIVCNKEAESVSGRVESDRHRHRDGYGVSEHHASNDPSKQTSRTKESDNNTQRKSKLDSDNPKDRRKERDSVHEKRKNQDRLTDDFHNEHSKRHVKDSSVKERDRNGYNEKSRDHESRKRHEREKRRSNSPSQRGNKQRLYDVREHEDKKRLSSLSLSNNDSINNKSKRHDTSGLSRLGGYSPRKRRNESTIKTPSPIDSPLIVKTEGKLSTSSQPDLSPLTKIEVTPNVVQKPSFGLLSISSLMNASVDSVQLTQATRPKRRIYVENLPSSASETAVVEWLSGYLRPYGLSHIKGTSPCISCIVNKDKCQALVEFLTPEDASTALSFDGKSFCGNILKIRRPKDYVETTTVALFMQTGVQQKPVSGGAVSIKTFVQDSPNKIFIGGISKTITSQMLMEIVTAFGPLKAYHFETNSDLDTPYAFLEYVDQSVTIKACVGLNGLKLGGQLLTVTQATPDTSSMDNHGDHCFYGTPAHAQPLLQKQTQVLKLNNLVDPQSLSSLSEQEFEEVLEDVRLECSRFGMVKSINIIKTKPPEEPLGGSIGGSEAAGAVDDGGGPENKPSEVERFDGGCVLVEYKRIEACEMAAHCLHGRVFDGRVVSVEYVAHDVYCGDKLVVDFSDHRDQLRVRTTAYHLIVGVNSGSRVDNRHTISLVHMRYSFTLLNGFSGTFGGPLTMSFKYLLLYPYV